MNDNSNGEWKATGETQTNSEQPLENDTTKRKIVGIYGLRNKITNKWYVGQSVDIIKRLEIDYKKMKCIGQPKIYNALLKYGYNEFDKIILEECESKQEILNEKEIYWMKYYDSIKNGYNLRGGGGGHGWHSEETKQKIRMARANQIIGKNHVSEEAKIKMSMERKGKSLSDETCIKLSISHLGNKHSEETKIKIRNTLRGPSSLK
jgi:group I intron endonuclease